MNIFGFQFSRIKNSKPVPVMGSAIKSPVVQPEHAAQLKQFLELADFQSKMLNNFSKEMTRTYDAAVTTNFNQDFVSTFGSANAEILNSLYLARSRARTLVKDFAQGKAIQRTYQNNVVGHDPFRISCRVGKFVKTGDKAKFVPESELNRVIEAEWHVASLQENFGVRQNVSRMEAYRIIEASAVRDGGIILRHHYGYPNKYGYAIDMLEIDRLQESYMGRYAKTGNQIRFSIEVDKWNRPVAYWLLTRHPGDIFGYNGPDGFDDTFARDSSNVWRQRIPAKDIIHFKNLRDRAEQDVGMPEIDSVIQDLHRDRQYAISLAYAAIASCCKPFWIKKEFPTGLQVTPDEIGQFYNSTVPAGATGPLGISGVPPIGNNTPSGRQEGIGIKTEIVSPAQTKIMNWGESLMQIDPKFPIEAASDYRRDNMMSAMVGAGVSYSSGTGDFQNLGFSASRLAELPQRDNFKVRQEHMIDDCVWLHFREWLKYAIMSGVFEKEYAINIPISRLNEICACVTFKGRRWPYVNPLQDVQTLIMMQEAGMISPQQIQDELENGINIADLYALIEEALALQEAHGLNFEDIEPTKPGVGKGEPEVVKPNPEDEAAQPEPKKGPKQTIHKGLNLGRIRKLLKDSTRSMTMKLLQMQGDGRNGYHD